MEQTPTDELTGIPLPIMPHDEVLERLANLRANAAANARGEDFADWNHVFHPRRDPSLISLDGQAVRSARGQFVMRSDHNTYHAIYSGPALPRNANERFRTLVFCAAGYVPREALDFSDGMARIRPMSDEQIRRLQTSGEVRIMQSETMRRFMHDYVLGDPETSHIPKRKIDEFISLSNPNQSDSSDDRRRRRILAHELLLQVIDPLTEPLTTPYRRSRQARLWRPEAHVSPQQVVQEQLLGTRPNKRHQNIQRIGSMLCTTFAKQREGSFAAA